MKKFFMIAACFLFLFKGEVAHAQEGKIKLQDVTNGVYWPKQIDGVNPMNDGESYTQLSPDHKRIVRHSFKTGKEIATVFDVETARGSKKLPRIDGYIMSPDEHRILIQTETKMCIRDRNLIPAYFAP